MYTACSSKIRISIHQNMWHKNSQHNYNNSKYENFTYIFLVFVLECWTIAFATSEKQFKQHYSILYQDTTINPQNPSLHGQYSARNQKGNYEMWHAFPQQSKRSVIRPWKQSITSCGVAKRSLQWTVSTAVSDTDSNWSVGRMPHCATGRATSEPRSRFIKRIVTSSPTDSCMWGTAMTLQEKINTSTKAINSPQIKTPSIGHKLTKV